MSMSKLTKGQENFLKNFFKIEALKAMAEKKEHTAYNRFSGEDVKVSPTVNKLLQFVFAVEGAFGNDLRLKRINPLLTVGNAVQKFDMARYTILALDSDAYMKLLD